MDGTLIDSERLWDVSLRATARELSGELSARAIASLVGVDIDTSIVVLLGDLGLPATPDRIAWMPKLCRKPLGVMCGPSGAAASRMMPLTSCQARDAHATLGRSKRQVFAPITLTE